MVYFTRICSSSYQISIYDSSIVTNCEIFKYISECNSVNCIYNRSLTNIRSKFESVVLNLSNKSNIKILFYGSFMLYQELQIIMKLKNRLKEIHFTDAMYSNMFNEDENYFYKKPTDNKYISAFSELLFYLSNNKIFVPIYIHTDPSKLAYTEFFKKRFDYVVGIDIDYIYPGNKIDNFDIMKNISINTIIDSGHMVISQNFKDLVDISIYKKNNKSIQLLKSYMYIKKEYILKNRIIRLFKKSQFSLSVLGLTLSCNNVYNNKYLATISGLIFAYNILLNLKKNNPVIKYCKLDDMKK